MKSLRILYILVLLALFVVTAGEAQQTLLPTVPADKRGDKDFERTGTHDANNIRTLFKNFGMVGSYPDAEGYQDVTKVDLSVFPETY